MIFQDELFNRRPPNVPALSDPVLTLLNALPRGTRIRDGQLEVFAATGAAARQLYETVLQMCGKRLDGFQMRGRFFL